MATIPQSQFKTQKSIYSTPTADIRPGSVGADTAALKGFSKEVTQMGGQMLDRIRESEAHSANVIGQRMRDKTSTDFKTNLLAASEKGMVNATRTDINPETNEPETVNNFYKDINGNQIQVEQSTPISEIFERGMTSYMGEYKKGLPSNTSVEMYQRQADRASSRDYLAMQDIETEQRIRGLDIDKEKVLSSRLGQLETQPVSSIMLKEFMKEDIISIEEYGRLQNKPLEEINLEAKKHAQNMIMAKARHLRNEGDISAGSEMINMAIEDSGFKAIQEAIDVNEDLYEEYTLEQYKTLIELNPTGRMKDARLAPDGTHFRVKIDPNQYASQRGIQVEADKAEGITNVLTTAQRSALIKEGVSINRGREAQVANFAIERLSQIRESVVNRGEELSGTEISRLKTDIMDNNLIPIEKQMQGLTELHAIEASQEFNKRMSMASPRDRLKMKFDLDAKVAELNAKEVSIRPRFKNVLNTESFVKASTKKVTATLGAKVNALSKQFAEDPSSYVIKHSPLINKLYRDAQGSNAPNAWNAYMNESINSQIKLGASLRDVKYLPKAELARRGDELKSLMKTSPGAASDLLGRWQSGLGNKVFKVMDDMVDSKNLDPDVMALTMITDRPARTKMMSNLSPKNKEAIEETWKGFVKVDALRKKDMSESIEDEMEEITPALNFSGLGGTKAMQNSIQSMISLEAKRQATSGVSIHDAVESAAELVLKSNFDVLGNIYLPKSLGTNMSTLETAVETYSRPKNFSKLGVEPPKEFMSNKVNADISKSEKRKRYYEKLSDDTEWATSPDGVHIQLFLKGDKGNTPMLDKNGKEITLDPTKLLEDINVLEQANRGVIDKAINK